jgi:hypothetical protein
LDFRGDRNMPKTIKFNIIVDNKSIRTLSDLKDNFNIDDLYDLYQNGILKKWLDVRGYHKEAEQLEQLQEREQNVAHLISRLIKIFAPKNESFNPREAAYSQLFKVKKEQRLKEAEQSGMNVNKIIEQYHYDYEMLLDSIKGREQNFDYIKSCINEISENYIDLFELDYSRFFTTFLDSAPLAVFAVLMNIKLRKYFREDDSINRILSTLSDDTSLYEKLGDNLKRFNGSTEGMWSYLGDVESKQMVIKMSTGACRAGQRGSEGDDVSADKINGQYIIFKGLLFKSTHSSHEILYLEV